MNKNFDPNLRALAERVHTPAYVFNSDVFRERAAQVKTEFGEKTGLCFSIKANPFLLKCLPAEFDFIEVCSPGELTICEQLGIDMGKIILSGVNKTREDVSRAMDDGVGVFTAESRLHLRIINEAAVERGIKVPLLLRLTAGSQFGMDRADIIDIVEHRAEYAGVRIVGLHYFSGTQKRKTALIERELDRVMDFVREVRLEHSFEFERLEYGSGLAVDYFTPDADETELEHLHEAAQKIRAVSEEIRLSVEMGRFFAAPCGCYFTRVMDIKTNEGVNYAIVDGGLNQLKYHGQIQGMQIPEITHIKAAPDACGEKQSWTLCGSLCTTADVLARNVELEGLAIGDILVFHRTGAYSVTEGMALFLSRELPEVSLYSAGGGIEKLRDILQTALFNMPAAQYLNGEINT